MTRTLIFCCLCLLPSLLFAHEGLRFRYLDLPTSLRDVNITHVAEDRKGIIWFTTSSGLHRYDGNRLLTFDLFSKPALISNAITYLLSDNQDRIWAGSANGLTMIDLHTWKATSWQYHPGTRENLAVKMICEGQDGTIYIISNNSVLRISNGKLTPLADFSHTASNPQVNGVFEPVKGELWVLVNGRLEVLRGGKTIRSFPSMELEDAIIEKVLFYKNGKVIFSVAGDGVYTGDITTGKISRWKHPLNDSLVRQRRVNFFSMKNGNVGVYINKYGFVAFNPETGKTQETDPETLQRFENAGMLMFAGRNDKTYFSFNKGIAVLEPVSTPFRNFLVTPSSETVPYSIRSIYRRPDSSWIIGNYRDGLTLLDERTGHARPLAQRFIYTMLPWTKDTLLAGTEGDGLQWMSISTLNITPVKKEDISFAKETKYIISLCRENDSLVWAGTYTGVFLLNIRSGRIVKVPSVYSHSRLMAAKINQVFVKGPVKYIATGAGLFIYDSATGKVFRAQNDQPETGVYCLKEVNGEIWAGTNGRGILVLDMRGKLISTINTNSGLAGNAVYSILLDGEHIVAGTDHGLSIVQVNTHAVRNYSRLDKLPSNEFNHSAAFQDGNRMYFGTIDGFTSFNPRDLANNDTLKSFPLLYFTSFTTSCRKGQVQDYTLPYKTVKALTVAAGTEYFSLRFGGPDQELRQLQYYYRLKEEEWKELGRVPEISFAGLAPGRYLVQLAARTSPGSPVQTLLSVPLTVFPAWYQTWWFRTLAVLFTALTIWLIYRYRLRQLLKEQQLRTKIAGDLHDEVGSSLTRIYFQADMLRMKEEHTPALQKIADTSRDALTTMSDMVWSIDARFDTAADLLSRMRDYLMKLQQELELSCNFQVTGEYEERALSQMIRQNFFLIFKEAVNNAARYSSEGKISISLHFGTRMELNVQNPCEELPRQLNGYQGGQGLQHMQLRAGRMKGEVETSALQGSFAVRLSVPW